MRIALAQLFGRSVAVGLAAAALLSPAARATPPTIEFGIRDFPARNGATPYLNGPDLAAISAQIVYSEQTGVLPNNDGVWRPVRWSIDGALTTFSPPSPYQTAFGRAISANGRVVAGQAKLTNAQFNATTYSAVRWVNGTPQVLPNLFTGTLAGNAGLFGLATACSQDGLVCVGISPGLNTQAFQANLPTVWTNGVASLPPLPAPPSGYGLSSGAINDVSADGQVIVGRLVWQTAAGATKSAAWRYDYRTNAHRTSQCTDGVCDGSLTRVSGNGSMSFGVGTFNDGLVHSFYWTATGLRTFFPLPPGAPAGAKPLPRDVNFDGTVVVGGINDANDTPLRPVVWRGSAVSGYTATFFDDELATAGVTPGASITHITHVSADGRAMMCMPFFNGSSTPKLWFARLPGADADGDGLLDAWETQGGGIDFNLDGVIDLDLYALGARPDHKDLFVEVDAMNSPACRMSDRTKLLVEQAFANAPVSNPDGTTGINLHIQRDDTDLPFQQIIDMSAGFPAAFQSWKSSRWGTASERASGNASNILAAKAMAFRYAVLVAAAPDGSTILGRGECPGNDSVSAFGAPTFNDGVRDNLEKAALFMHEFGHNLGLGHGGVDPDTGEPDSTNAKPNYPSIMNYSVGFPSSANLEFWKLDFCRERLADLDETSLNEQTGIPSTLYRAFEMAYAVRPPSPDSCELGNTNRWITLDGSPADYNRDGAFGVVTCAPRPVACDPTCGPYCPDLVDATAPAPSQCGQFCWRPCPDLNYIQGIAHSGETVAPSPGEMLRGCNDWTGLRLPIGFSGAFAEGPPLPPTFPEPTFADTAVFQASLPPPSRRCPPDIGGGPDDFMPDGLVNVNDIFEFLAGWFASVSPADFNRNGAINVQDIFDYLSAWFAGC